MILQVVDCVIELSTFKDNIISNLEIIIKFHSTEMFIRSHILISLFSKAIRTSNNSSCMCFLQYYRDILADYTVIIQIICYFMDSLQSLQYLSLAQLFKEYRSNSSFCEVLQLHASEQLMFKAAAQVSVVVGSPCVLKLLTHSGYNTNFTCRVATWTSSQSGSCHYYYY